MSDIVSQIISLTIVYSTVYSVTDERKYHSSASLAIVRRSHRWLVISPHKWPVTRKMFPFDDIIMDNQLQDQKTPVDYRTWLFKFDTNEAHEINIFHTVAEKMNNATNSKLIITSYNHGCDGWPLQRTLEPKKNIRTNSRTYKFRLTLHWWHAIFHVRSSLYFAYYTEIFIAT